jgi:hypothetical protein
MFYVCGPQGFLVFKPAHVKGPLLFSPDMREAQPFTSFKAADDFARGRLGETYYGIANTGYRDDPVSPTPHHFDIGQRVKVVRGLRNSTGSVPETVRSFYGFEGTVLEVYLSEDNEWTYVVEIAGEQRALTAKHLTEAKRNDEQ